MKGLIQLLVTLLKKTSKKEIDRLSKTKLLNKNKERVGFVFVLRKLQLKKQPYLK
jgi:hypothetical protein